MKKYITAIFLTFILLLTAGCTKSVEKKHDSKGISIVTSFYPIYAMTKAVSGDLNDVRMIQSSSGIHSFEPSPNDVAAIYKANLFIYHSHTLEAWASRLHDNAKQSKVTIFEASKPLKLERVKGLEDVKVAKGMDPAKLYDPHTWTDPILASKEVDNIAKELAKLDPKNADYYENNAKSFKKEAQKITDKYQKKFKTVKSKTFVTQHTAFSYLAKRFGLRQLGISGISPEQEPTPRQLMEIQDFIKQYKVTTIFAEDNVSPKIANTIAKATGAKVEKLSPLEAAPKGDKTYLENLESNLENLYNNLK